MKVLIGTVAVINGKPFSGAQYSSGTKCYKTEGIARAAVTWVLKYRPKPVTLEFVSAYIEVPDKENA